MAGRRDQVLDAAILVLSSVGARGLTYAAVDSAALAPAGTTSNHFRNRAALLDGVVAHLVELDRRDWESFAGELRPTTAAEVAEALTSFARYAVGPGRARSTARYNLFLAAIAAPELAEPLARGRAEIVGWGSTLLAGLGSADPGVHCDRLVDYLDGVILHQLAFPSVGFDPAPGIEGFLRQATAKTSGSH